MENLTGHKPASKDSFNREQQFTTYIAFNKAVSRGKGLLVRRDCTVYAKSSPWEDTECFQAQYLPYKVTRDHLKPQQRMGPDPGFCITPTAFLWCFLPFPLPPFVVCLRRDKYLPSFFGLQYVIPSGNQRLEFKRWSLLTFDPGASHPAVLSPWKWIVKWKNGSRQSL